MLEEMRKKGKTFSNLFHFHFQTHNFHDSRNKEKGNFVFLLFSK